MDTLLKMAAALAIILAALSMFSSLSWLMRLRILAVIAFGMIAVGLLTWSATGQWGPDGIVTFPSFVNSLILLFSAFASGFIAYFIAWPYGRQIAPLAVPVGLAVWAARSASIGSLMQKTIDAAGRYQVLNQFKWTAILWLTPVAVGFAGILLAELLTKGKVDLPSKTINKSTNFGDYAGSLTALIGSVLIILFCIKIFAQDIKFSDSRLGSVIAQPSSGQIAFAVAVSFGIAAFVIKLFLNAGYIWSIAACVFLPPLCISLYAKADTVAYIADNFPAIFFTHPAVAILPLQIVTFGVLGAIGGYWFAIVYKIWRTEEAL